MVAGVVGGNCAPGLARQWLSLSSPKLLQHVPEGHTSGRPGPPMGRNTDADLYALAASGIVLSRVYWSGLHDLYSRVSYI